MACVFGGNPDPGLDCSAFAESVRCVDLLLESLGVDGEAVDVAEGHPAGGEDAVELDDPPHQVRRRLLPEGVLPAAEELVEKRGERVGQAVAVQVGREGIPLPAPAEREFDVVVPAAGVREDLADVVAEVALDLEDKRRRPLAGVVGLPGEQLLGEGPHAAAGLPGADGSEDGDAGVEAPLRDGQPFRLRDLLGLDRVMQFAYHEGGCIVLRGGRPGRQDAPAAALRVRPRLQPETARSREEQDGGEGKEAGDG